MEFNKTKNYNDAKKYLNYFLKNHEDILEEYNLNKPSNRDKLAQKLAQYKMYKKYNIFRKITYEVIYDFCKPNIYKDYKEFEQAMKDTQISLADIVSENQNNELYRKQEQLHNLEEKIDIVRKRTNKITKIIKEKNNADAICEEIADELRRSIRNHRYDPTEYANKYTPQDSVMFMLLSDIHAGKKVDVGINQISKEIILRRLIDYRNATIEQIKEQKPNIVFIAMLGDYIEGLLHEACLIESDITSASEQAHEVTWMIYEQVIDPIVKIANRVIITGVAGNHDVTRSKKNARTHEDTYFSHIMHYLTQEVRHANDSGIYNVEMDKDYGFYENGKWMRPDDYNYKRISIFNGKKEIVLTHGDKIGRSGDKWLAKASRGKRNPDYVFAGHYHSCASMSSVNGCTIYFNGCVCGPDTFATSLGMVNEPSQRIITIKRMKIEDNIDGCESEVFVVNDCNVPLLYGWRGYDVYDKNNY